MYLVSRLEIKSHWLFSTGATTGTMRISTGALAHRGPCLELPKEKQRHGINTAQHYHIMVHTVAVTPVILKRVASEATHVGRLGMVMTRLCLPAYSMQFSCSNTSCSNTTNTNNKSYIRSLPGKAVQMAHG